MSEPGGALHWSKTGALALAGAVLLPALAAAQRANPIYRPTMQDLGDWDAVVDVRLHDGRRQKRAKAQMQAR